MLTMLALMGCVDAVADPPVVWEYGTLILTPTCPVFVGPKDPPLPTMPDGAADYSETRKRCLQPQPTAAALLSQIGAQGWELVTIQAEYTYFKRRK